jgi:hypothetical protein
MINFFGQKPRHGASAIAVALGISAVLSLGTGCSGNPGNAADNRFTTPSNDEYTQPLTNAVIGSPSGVVVIGSNGEASPAAAPLDSGLGGSSGTIDGGSSGASGTFSGTTGTGTGSTGASGTGFGTSGSFSTGSAGSMSSSGSLAGSSGDVVFLDGGPPVDGGGGAGGFGQWHFDDCSPTSNFLIDSSGGGANAQHALKADCVPGISGLGVEFRSAKDVVQVPDEPQFVVTNRVGVAAWVFPNTVTGDEPIVIKRANSDTSFSLGIHKGNIQMSVVTASGTTVISQAPIAAGTWTHVAGMYDGTFVFLFINGQTFGQVYVGEALQDVFAPIRIGATTGSQFFDGIIDEVFLSMQPISQSTLTSLACISKPPTATVSPQIGPPVTFDTPVHYDITVANDSVGFCPALQIDAFSESSDSTINTEFTNQFTTVAPGASVDIGVDVTASDEANPGTEVVPIEVETFQDSSPFNENFFTEDLVFNLLAPQGCFVFTARELMITDTSVVDDPVRTFGVTDPGGGFVGDGGIIVPPGSSGAASGSVGVGVGVGAPAASSPAAGSSDASAPPSSTGVWTFGHFMQQLAPSDAEAPAFTLALFQHWLTNQTVNGFTVVARPAIQQVVLDAWPKTATGDLDLTQPPLRLQAIVNRIDVRNLAAGSAGEGRLVFAVNGAGFPQLFTVIIEYNLPATTQSDVQNWANLWHNLSSLPFPSEQYNAALEAIVHKFSDRGAGAGLVNGSNLVELRTNEIALSFQWELRAFQLDATTGFLDETDLKETPDLSFNGTQTFSDFVNENAAAIIAEIPGANDNTVPLSFEGQNFRAGSIFNNQIEWDAPGITTSDARFHASMNTCNGCHGPDTGTFNFTMIAPRNEGQPSVLSPFLTGTTVIDDFSGETRTLNDLLRRRTDLTSLVCTDAGAPPPPPPADASTEPLDAGAPPLDASFSVVP